MDWKREAVDKLKHYEARRTSIARITSEIRRLEIDATKIRSATKDGMPVSGGTNAREDAIVSNIVKRGELKLALQETYLWVETVEGALDTLDEGERHILDRFYINRMRGNLERLCDELHLEKTRVYELKDAALRHFTLALYGVTET